MALQITAFHPKAASGHVNARLSKEPPSPPPNTEQEPITGNQNPATASEHEGCILAVFYTPLTTPIPDHALT